MADAPPDDPPPEDPRDRAIRIITIRMDLIVRAIRREFSSMGRTLGGEEFERLWKEAEEMDNAPENTA